MRRGSAVLGGLTVRTLGSDRGRVESNGSSVNLEAIDRSLGL